ncbi:MAG: peptidyl-prolyl cis-trans isomerase [Alphaproteobacteria bacterium]
MAMQALQNGAKHGVLKYFLLGLLALAGGGLVFTDVGGFFRGGSTGANNVAKIGKQTVSLQQFDMQLRRQLSQIGISPEQALQLGYTNEILRGEINRRLLINAASDAGINVDKSHAVKQIQTYLAPAVASGMSVEQALANILRNQGMSEAQLLDTIRAERAVTLFGEGLQGGAAIANPLISKDLYAVQNETRDVDYLLFLDKDIDTPPAPSDDQLQQIYETTKEQYAIAEQRDLSLLTLKADDLRETLEVSEDDLRAAYEDSIDQYTTPAQRTLAQILFQSEEEANAAYDKIQGGAAFDAIAKSGDLIPAKAYGEDALLEELRDTVFAADAKGILAPIETPLGWNIVNISKTKDEAVQDFDAVKGDIRKDVVEERLIDEIYRIVDEMDEFFIGGGDAKAAIENFNLTSQPLKNISRFKANEAVQKALGGQVQDALKAAFDASEGEAIAVIELDNGDFATLFVDGVTPKSYKPFEDVKGDILAAWNADQKALSNTQTVTALLQGNEGKTLKEIAKDNGRRLRTLNAAKRDQEVAAPLSALTLSAAFGADKGAIKSVKIDGGLALIEVTGVSLPQKTDQDALKAFEEQALNDVQNEVFGLYLNHLVQDNGVSVNEALLQRAYGQSEEGL